MKKGLKRILSTVLASAMLFSSMTVVNTNTVFAADIQANSVGWHETAYTEWLPVSGAASYEAYVKKTSDSSYTPLDDELVREYDTFVRADALGLAAGTYNMKIVAKNSSGAEIASYESGPITVDSYIRDGFAFSDGGSSSGAYNDDGTLKSNAKVFYVTEENKDSITMDVVTSSKGTTTSCTGMGAIIKALEKGEETTPLDFRFIGQVSCPKSEQKLNQIDIKRAVAPITIEGVGNDAFALFDFNLVEANNVEVRNLGFKDMTTKDEDGVTIKDASQRIWVHNCDFFYGGQGSDEDQAKGDGAVDLKGTSTKITVSDNHYWDSGKVNLCGLGESADYEISYARNWFDHSDSRHPRVRTGSIHVYNNYYDGVAKYGVGACTGSSIFVEGNYFRNTSKPVMSSKQGTDAQGSGTFSSEAGGIIKMYDNIMVGTYTFIEANLGNGSYNLDSDGYTVSSRNETVPSDVKTVSGGTAYNNFDTTRDLGVDASGVLAAKDVPAYVTANAGRIDGGNFKYIFDDSTEDSNYDVIPEMTNALGAYKYKADTAYVSSMSATGIDGNAFYTERTNAYESKNATLPAETDPEGNKATGGGSGGGSTSSTVDLSLNADDVDTGAYTNTTVSGLGTNGAFSIIANTSDAVTVSSSKGIQLGGAGNVSTGKRLISVTLEKPGTIYVRCSSTGTDERTINVSDINGDIKGTIQTGSSDGVHVDTAGTYYIYSSNKGINVSVITVSYDGSEGSSQTTTKSEAATETTTKATETTTSAVSGGDDETEATTSAPVTPPSGDNVINSSMTLSRGTNDSYVTVNGDKNSSGAWKVDKAKGDTVKGYLMIKLGKTADITITGGGEKAISISQTVGSTSPEYKANAAAQVSFSDVPAGTWYIYNTDGNMTIDEIVVTMDGSSVDPDPTTTTTETITEATTASATTTTEVATDEPTEGTTEATDYLTIDSDMSLNNDNVTGNRYFNVTGSKTSGANELQLGADGKIEFTVADGATVSVTARHANSKDTADRTLSMSNGAEITYVPGEAVKTDVLGTNLPAGTYTITVSNSINITSLDITFTSEPEPSVIKGDANGDGVVTSADVKEILNYVVGLIESVANPEAADVNNDSKVSSSDAYIIQKYINKGVWQ